uniref:Uncharacterized protein n=1 Tax=viral metagenome TaxID=1070528 RepID=A0A6C0J023_9ZZZZ
MSPSPVLTSNPSDNLIPRRAVANAMSQGKIKARSRRPKRSIMFAQTNARGLGFHYNNRDIYRNGKSQAINMFVVDRLEAMKKGVIKKIPKRIKDERNSNKNTLRSALLSTDRSEVALFLKSAMDFGRLDKSRPYLNMKRAATQETEASGRPNLGWYFQSLATEAQKRFEIQKTQRFLTNHNYYKTLRRSSYSFMDRELPKAVIEVSVGRHGAKKQKQKVKRPGRKTYYKVINSTTKKIKTENGVEYENHPSVVKLEGFEKNEIVINFSLTPLGRVMFHESLLLLPEYYMIAKFIQYYRPSDELLLRYLNIQSKDLKIDMKKKNIVEFNESFTANEMPIISQNNLASLNRTAQRNVNKRNNIELDNTAVKWKDGGIVTLHLKLAEFFASSIVKDNTIKRKDKYPTPRSDRDPPITSNADVNLSYFKNILEPLQKEKKRLYDNPYDTLFEHIHSIDVYGRGDSNQSFKNTTGKRIESVDFREIDIDKQFEKIHKTILEPLFETDEIQLAFETAIKSYSNFLDKEYKLRKYYKKSEGGESVDEMVHVPQEREIAFRLKERDLRYWEELVLLKNMIFDCINIRDELKKFNDSSLLNIIHNGDESAMFTNPYTDKSTLFRNMNFNNAKYVLSTGIYIDDSQFVFDYLSRKHLTLQSRITQYERYLELLSKYSVIRNSHIKMFYEFATKQNITQGNSHSQTNQRDSTAKIIIKCDFLISKIIDAINQSNEWFSKRTKLTFTKHLGGKLAKQKRSMNNSFMDSSAKKSQHAFDTDKYDYIYALFRKLVDKFNRALDQPRICNKNTDEKIHKNGRRFIVAKNSKEQPIQVYKSIPERLKFRNDLSYRDFLKKMDEAPFTKEYREYRQMKNRTKINEKKRKTVVNAEFVAARKHTTFLAEEYYPLVHAFQSSGFADRLKPTLNGSGLLDQRKIIAEFTSIYGKGTINGSMKKLTLYDFLQLISGINRGKLKEMNLTDNDIGYNVFQGGKFHEEFGMVFCPFLPAYSKATPPEAKPFSVPVISEESIEILGESSFKISWPLQLYGREGDQDLPGRAPQAMFQNFTFADGDFGDEKITKGEYVDGYGNFIGGSEAQRRVIQISKTVKNKRGTYVPLHGVPYVTANQLTGDRYFTGRSTDHTKVVGDKEKIVVGDRKVYESRFDVGGIKVRTWIRDSTSRLSVDTKALIDSSTFFFNFNNKVASTMTRMLEADIQQQNLENNQEQLFPTSWRTDKLMQQKNLQTLMNAEKFGPQGTTHEMTFAKVLKHTNNVQQSIIDNCINTAKLLFPSFTWQNMIILFSKNPLFSNARAQNVNETPILSNLKLQNSDLEAVEKYFKKIVSDFMFASVYVSKSDTEWCAVQFLPYIDNTKNDFQRMFSEKLTSLGLNVYGVHTRGANNNNNKHIFLWLPVDATTKNANNDTIEHRIVDGQAKNFYKEKNVVVLRQKYGYIILSCSWFKRTNGSLNRGTSEFGKIHHNKDTNLKFNAAKHNNFEWAAMLELHRLSARCFSKAAALQQMFESENTQAASRRLFKDAGSSLYDWWRHQYLAVAAYLAKRKKIRGLRRMSKGQCLRKPSKNKKMVRASSIQMLPTKKGNPKNFNQRRASAATPRASTAIPTEIELGKISSGESPQVLNGIRPRSSPASTRSRSRTTSRNRSRARVQPSEARPAVGRAQSQPSRARINGDPRDPFPPGRMPTEVVSAERKTRTNSAPATQRRSTSVPIVSSPSIQNIRATRTGRSTRPASMDRFRRQPPAEVSQALLHESNTASNVSTSNVPTNSNVPTTPTTSGRGSTRSVANVTTVVSSRSSSRSSRSSSRSSPTAPLLASHRKKRLA